jgi:hypothetical protein
MLEVEDVACPVDDYDNRLFTFFQRGRTKGEKEFRRSDVQADSEGPLPRRPDGERLWTWRNPRRGNYGTIGPPQRALLFQCSGATLAFVDLAEHRCLWRPQEVAFQQQ